MSKKALFFVYFFFFFMYFVGFALMGNLNSGSPIHLDWLIHPFNISKYIYTLLTVVLSHFVVFRKFYYQRPRWKLLAALVALLLFFILFRYLLEEVIYPALLGYGNYNPATTFRFYIIDNVYFGSIIIFIGFVLFLFDEMFRNQQKQAALQQQNRQAELNFLQAQMNPHFLFNSLNNIYSLAYEQHPKTAESVLKLSDLMRYVTYEREKLVPVSKEMEYVRSMIDIQQLRHDYKLNVAINIAPETALYKIPPLLLVPLVENALKHGDLSSEDSPLQIIITPDKEKVKIIIKNKIAPYQHTVGGGVGLKNLARRLELLYRPGEYVFMTEKKEMNFSVVLLIPHS